MKMEGLCWTAVTLVWFLSAGNSLNVEDQNDLAKIVNHFLDRYIMKTIEINNVKYTIEGQVSFAVNIPVNQDLNKLEEVFEKDPPDTVIEKVSKNEVYQGTSVVAAKFKRFGTFTDHAEARVLDNIQPLADRSQGHSLVLYSYLSPCGTKCTNEGDKNNILKKINNLKSTWKNIVFVFFRVYSIHKGTDIDEADIARTLEQLGKTKIGHNIFRCYKSQGALQCIKCYSNNSYEKKCVNNEA